MSDRQTPNMNDHTRFHGSATRGAQYRDDQPAGVDNSQQAAQGSRVAAGVTGRRADTCTLGTADFPLMTAHDIVAGMQAAFAELERRGPLPMADVFLHPYDFDRLVRGKDPGELKYVDGLLCWEWHGGGIRYWRGQKEFPRG